MESRSLFVVATEVATLRPGGPMTPARRRAIASARERSGPREDRSRAALRRVFRRLRYLTKNLPRVALHRDAKPAYRSLIAQSFSGRELHIATVAADAAESKALQPINTMHAIARDLVGRLRRESWLVSEQRRFLRLQLHLFTAYKNFIRKRTNRDSRSPASYLGFLPRRLRYKELLSWRQDWRGRCISILRTC